jgi:tetratricopeptide (TPR) repeat protein
MGALWAAGHLPTGLPVAVKIAHPVQGDRAGQNAWFLDEVRVMAALDHPHIVRVFDHGLVSQADAVASGGQLIANQPYLVTEYAHGGTLQARRGRLAWPELRTTLVSLLRALAHAHARGVLHRDVKPSNVLASDPRDFRTGIRLAEFGLAWRVADHRRLTAAGTPLYMPPEQINALVTQLGPWTDLYALGGMAWELATGEAPFGHLSDDQLWSAQLSMRPGDFQPRQGIPAALEPWCRKLLEKDPNVRYQRAADALAALPANLAGSLSEQVVGHSRPSDHPAMGGLGLGLFGLNATPIVGHAIAKQELWGALERAAGQGRTQVVVLEGAAGLGKTRLTHWLTARAHEAGLVEWFRTEHGPRPALHQGLPGLLDQAYRTTGCTRATAARTLTALARAHRAPQDPVERRALLNIFRPTASLNYTPEHSRTRHALARAALGMLAKGRTPLLVFEDVDWSDEALAFSRHWLADPDAAPALIVLTRRNDGEAPIHPELAPLLETQNVVRLRLMPLSADESRTLVESLLALTLAALLGPRVAAEEWKRACSAIDVTEPVQVATLELLQAAALADPIPGGFALAHRLLQESLVERARGLATGWRTLHAVCAAAIRDGPEQDGRRAHHLIETGRQAEARPLLISAASQAQRRGHLHSATRLLGRLQIEGAPDALRARAAVVAYFLAANRLDQDALRVAAEQCQALLGSRDPTARVLAGGVWSRWLARTRPGDAVQLARKAWQDARRLSDPVLQARAGETLIYCLTWAGKPNEAARAQRRTADCWQLAGRKAAAAMVRAQSALAGSTTRSQLEEACADAHRARKLFARSGDRANAAGALNTLGELHRRLEQPHLAAKAYLAAKPLAEAADRSLICGLALNLGMVHISLGDLAAAKAAGERALSEAQVQREVILGTCARALLLVPAAELADSADWLRQRDETRRDLTQTGVIEPDRARCFLAAERVAEAAGHLDRAEDARALAKAQLAALGTGAEELAGVA